MSTKNHFVPQTVRKGIIGIWDKVYLWLFSQTFSWIIVLTLSLFYRKRMSHDNGIAGTGKLTIIDDPKFPAHSFFSPGKVYSARVRHASATFLDDAMNCIRSMSVKFNDHHFKSPFDIEMNTGEVSLFWSAHSFLQFAKLRKQKYGIEYVDYYKKYPEGLKGAEVALRQNPTSFHNLRYYCKTPFKFIGEDTILRYAKYRVKPLDDEPETGLNQNYTRVERGNQRVLPNETRGRNYLKYEYEERVKNKGAKYMMQIQTRIAQDDEDPEIFNNMVPWNEKAHPWHDLAIIEIEKTLDWKESTRTSFSLNNMPKTLGIIKAHSIYDYNSLNYMRAHSEKAKLARMMSYKIFGYPKPIPNNDDRNSEDWVKIQKEKVSNLSRS